MKYTNIILVLFLFFNLTSCNNQKDIQFPNPTVAKVEYFNEHRNGYLNDSIFEVNNVSSFKSKYFNRELIDTNKRYFLSINQSIPYSETYQIVIYRIDDRIFIKFKQIQEKIKSELTRLENCSSISTIEAEVSKDDFDFIEAKIADAIKLKENIKDFEGWQYFSDGGFSMELCYSNKYFAWAIDYVDAEGMKGIEKLWFELINNKPFSDIIGFSVNTSYPLSARRQAVSK